MPTERRFSGHFVPMLLVAALLSSCDPAPAEIREPNTEPGQQSQALSAASCPAGYRVLLGTAGPDTLYGGSGKDCIVGLGGNDLIYGNGSNDFIIGGEGNDTIHGGDGNDTVHGESGNDTLHGEGGADTLEGGEGDDLVNGGLGKDILLGGAGKDRLNGGDGDDTLRGGDDDDVLHGDLHIDELYGDQGDDILDGDASNDKLFGGDGHDVLYGDANNDTLNGEAGDDALLGGSGTNIIDGGPGTDACAGTGCERPALVLSGCAQDGQCPGGARCISDFGLCLPRCISDQDSDGSCDSDDGCPLDAGKLLPGVCGCGVSDLDSDQDAVSDCLDGCPNDRGKSVAGVCGCGVADLNSDGDALLDCQDACPVDPDKIAVGSCGCGVADADSDADGHADCVDVCPGAHDDLDQDANGTPDGCQVPTDCTPTTVGIGVWQGSLWVSEEATLASLAGVTCITGDLTIQDQDSLLGLSSLRQVVGSLSISGNPELESLAGLEALEEIGGALSIGGNPALHSIEELASLENLGALLQASDVALHVHDNDALPACQVWELSARTGRRCGEPAYGMTCDGNLGAGNCGELPSTFVCAPGASGPGVYDGDVSVQGQASLPFGPGNVTCITGSLTVNDTDDLSAFSHLQKVGGTLTVAFTSLNNLGGLERLSDVGGLVIHGNPQLSSLSALASLSGVNRGQPSAWLNIASNESLPACQAWGLAAQVQRSCTQDSGWGPQNLCFGNRGDGNCGSLPADFQCLPGAVGPGIYDGNVDTYGPDLAELGGVTCITGGLWLAGSVNLAPLSHLQKVGGELHIANTQLVELSALGRLSAVGSRVEISSNPQLSSLHGLEALQRVDGDLGIHGNSTLQDVLALSSLTSIGHPDIDYKLQIRDNAQLPACQVWEISARTGGSCHKTNGYGMPSCTGNDGAANCGSLPADFACVPGAAGPGVYDGDVSMHHWSDAALSNLSCVTGSVGVDQRNDLHALSSLQKVGNSLRINANQGLTSLDGLSRLTEVGGYMEIWGNPLLANISALANLVRVGAAQPDQTLQVADNASLPACAVHQLFAQVGQHCHHASWCAGNGGTASCGELPPDFVCAPGADGPGVFDGSAMPFGQGGPDLSGVTCVTGDLWVDSLAGLAQLGSLQMVGGELRLFGGAIVSVDVLSRLRTVGGRLAIGSTSLSELTGLRNLVRLGEQGGPFAPLSISYNSQLSECWVRQLEAQTGSSNDGCYDGCQNEGLGSCGTLPEGFACVPGAKGLGVYDGPIPNSDFSSLRGITCITGDLLLGAQHSQANLLALEHLQKVGGRLAIDFTNLGHVDGLENLTVVGGSLSISGNPALLELSGLSSLSSIGAAAPGQSQPLFIHDNPQLPGCWASLLSAQTGLACEPDYLCSGNDGTGSCSP